jgi:hypothetical protein
MDRAGAYSPNDRRMYPFHIAVRNSAVLKSLLFLSKVGSTSRSGMFYRLDATEAEMVHGQILENCGPTY